jgi:hypothetical protein
MRRGWIVEWNATDPTRCMYDIRITIRSYILHGFASLQDAASNGQNAEVAMFEDSQVRSFSSRVSTGTRSPAKR